MIRVPRWYLLVINLLLPIALIGGVYLGYAISTEATLRGITKLSDEVFQRERVRR